MILFLRYHDFVLFAKILLYFIYTINTVHFDAIVLSAIGSKRLFPDYRNNIRLLL